MSFLLKENYLKTKPFRTASTNLERKPFEMPVSAQYDDQIMERLQGIGYVDSKGASRSIKPPTPATETGE